MTKTQKYGKKDCQEDKHRTDMFHFLSIFSFHHVCEKVSLCPLKFLFIPVEVGIIILKHVSMSLESTIDWTSFCGILTLSPGKLYGGFCGVSNNRACPTSCFGEI